MAAIVFLIEQIALGLYVFIGLGIIWYLRKFASEQGAMRSSGFELERELARFRRANAVMFLILLVEAGLIVLGVQTVVAPYVREQVDTSLAAAQVIEDLTFNTPTPALLAPVNIDSSGIEFEPTDPASVIRITPTPTETPPGTIEPNAPEPIGCDTDNATLRVPRNGQVVHQVVEVIGTAYVDNFAFYKLEISGPSTNGQYGTIEQLTQPVTTTGRLSQFNPIAFEEGWYLYRVGVFNNTGQLAASCAVNIYIRPPIPTSTPIVQN
jgi:hypothetical protein